MKVTPISAESYIRNEMSKGSLPHTDNKFTELVGCFAQLHKCDISNEMETDRKDMVANTHTIQPPRHMKAEHSETISQKGNRIKDMQNTKKKHTIKKHYNAKMSCYGYY